jgi:3-hydroxyacyl-CoA dehydrogenase
MPPDLNTVIAQYEASPKLVVAAIHGTALGGGLEVAFGCHYRCAVASGQVGFPEVKLGILPGAGGTQRLPRLTGVEAALPLIVAGDPIPAAKAQALGIIDEIVPGDLLDGACAFAERIVAEGKPLRRIRDMQDKVRGTSPAVFAEFRKGLERSARGSFAPFRCVDALEAAATLPFDEGLKRERELFGQCMQSTQSKAQIHVFFAEREIGKIPDVPKETPVKAIAKAVVIGAGTMGGGIAMNFANAGIPVRVIEMSQEALDRGLAVVRKNYAATVEKGRLSQKDMDTRMGLIQGTLGYDAVAEADIVVEAVFEEMDVKKKVFAALDKAARPDAILASNTSTLDIDQMASATSRPGQVIGTHFFSPANVMRLLEIVRGKATSKEVIATTMELARRIRKVGVLVGNCDGFVGNRMLAPYLREAEFLVEEGATPQQVDKVIYDFGLPWALRHGRHGRPGRGLAHPQGQGGHSQPPCAVFPRRGSHLRAGALRSEDRRRLVPLREGQPRPRPRSRDRGADRQDREGAGHRAPGGERRGDPQALRLCPHQRGGAHPRGRVCAAVERHRHHLHLRLRLSGAPGRPHVLRGHRGPRRGL